MLAIDVIVPTGPRLWQKLIVERLRSAGHDIAVVRQPDAGWPGLMRAALAFERQLVLRRPASLASIVPDIEELAGAREPALRLDLCGAAPKSELPTLRLGFDGGRTDASALLALAQGRLPEIRAVLDGRVVGFASPMADTPQSVALAAEDVLARAITLTISVVKAFEERRLGAIEPGPIVAKPSPGGLQFGLAYAGSALPRLGAEVARRAFFRQAHWRVGYRFIDGLGVAETGTLGTGWSVLGDNGDRFYADPFPFMAGGRHFIFVEDCPHATGKAMISVVEFDERGGPKMPRPVLEEPWHLSYPQVFERDGAIWMLPEASASGKLTLYRAEAFPDQWVPVKVLIDGRQISDATLVEHGGRLWLLATDRDGHGSTSDTLVVFHASALLGPWTPHRLNPVLIDRRSARPGGAVVQRDGRLVLPVQDGTLGYGGGLGLAMIEALDEERVRLAPPQPVSAAGDWPYPKIHTLNRAGSLEVIDGIAAVRKRSSARQ